VDIAEVAADEEENEEDEVATGAALIIACRNTQRVPNQKKV